MKAIQVKFLGPTNTRGSRWKAMAEGVKSITTAFSYSDTNYDNAEAAATMLCQKYNWPDDLLGGQLPNGDYVFVFNPIGQD